MNENEKKPSRSAVLKNTFYAAKVIMKASPFLLPGFTLSVSAYWLFDNYIKNVYFLDKMLNIVTEGGTFESFMKTLIIFCVAGVVAQFCDCAGDYIASTENKKFTNC